MAGRFFIMSHCMKEVVGTGNTCEPFSGQPELHCWNFLYKHFFFPRAIIVLVAISVRPWLQLNSHNCCAIISGSSHSCEFGILEQRIGSALQARSSRVKVNCFANVIESPSKSGSRSALGADNPLWSQLFLTSFQMRLSERCHTSFSPHLSSKRKASVG